MVQTKYKHLILTTYGINIITVVATHQNSFSIIITVIYSFTSHQNSLISGTNSFNTC